MCVVVTQAAEAPPPPALTRKSSIDGLTDFTTPSSGGANLLNIKDEDLLF